MNASSPAHAYQKISELQREHGKKLIHEELQPRPGDIVLDLGCGTGELSAYIAELVAENGKVLGVDPDSERIKLAQSAHKGIKNLTFVEGSTSHFPNLGSENFDSMLPYFPDTPISGHFDSTILYFVVKTKQIRTIRSEDLSTSLLSSVLFAAELRFV